MKIGDRVLHDEYGSGTVIKIMYEGRKRECYIVCFVAAHNDLHNGFGLTADNHAWICGNKELVKI